MPRVSANLHPADYDTTLQRLRAVPTRDRGHLAIEADLLLLRFEQRTDCAPLQHACETLGRAALCLTFVEQGQLNRSAGKGNCWVFEAGQTIAMLLREPSQARCCWPGKGASGLHLLMGEQTLCRYMGEEQARRLLGCQGEAPLMQRKTSRDANSHVHALVSRWFQPQASPLEIHLHVLSLLATPLQKLRAPAPGERSILPGADVKRLQQARQVMLDELDQPLSVQVLCERVGLSAAKLKQGFHQLFDTTPYRMLLELRMQHAYTLLQDGCQVAQVGYKVGYSHPSNFSAAFSGYFGFAPKLVGQGRTG
ncbi:AraC family transcriptional regulator [Pseudomonas capsici]|uniref:helix-turn-helix transcriptional regulator n=1 Tax=Pseudomonas capsici TaxID=2810614 RepID=UPI0021F10E2F|nr:AraC family transcriptional regulator [Pseudomonas capsici]MCV4289010.1 AraC family transcriptional regulator [Pseudomonas capsici]